MAVQVSEWTFWGKYFLVKKTSLSISAFSSGQKSFSRVVEIVLYKSRGTYWGKSFLNIWFFLDIEPKCFCFCCKFFNKLVKTAFQVFRWKLAVNYHNQKLPFFIILGQSAEKFQFSGVTLLPVLSELHSMSPEQSFVEKNFVFRKNYLLYCRLESCAKNCQTLDGKITPGFFRLHPLCGHEHFVRKLFFKNLFIINFAKKGKNLPWGESFWTR